MTAPALRGRSLIAGQFGGDTAALFHGIDAMRGTPLDPAYCHARSEDIDKALSSAAAVAREFAASPGTQRAGLLRAIATGLLESTEAITARMVLETALPMARAQGELGRTVHQLRLFADLLDEGSWQDARIDHGDPQRAPIPKPDLRSHRVALGPVVVFAACNFPLAFSVAGGDTASALAAGCPVIVKAHPAHPGVSELVGRIISQALTACGLPAGAFSLLFVDHDQAAQLVLDTRIRAVAFTGSQAVGLKLMKLVQSRAAAIPIFAEMGSLNPLVILPGALQDGAESLVEGLANSLTQGFGQFCTRPGLVLAPAGAAGEAFISRLRQRLSEVPPACLLHDGIAQRYRERIGQLDQHTGTESRPGAARAVAPALHVVDGERWRGDASLREETFGPACLVVTARDPAQWPDCVDVLEGQLTASVFGSEQELRDHADLIAALQERVGRILFNGFPTGVEVNHAIVHGGPFPATSDGQSTSVGSGAILRFTRPLAYQNWPDALLPAALQEANPLGIWRLVDGRREGGGRP